MRNAQIATSSGLDRTEKKRSEGKKKLWLVKSFDSQELVILLQGFPISYHQF